MINNCADLACLQVVLSACSTYFDTILSQYEEKDPIVIMRDVKFSDIKVLVEFMYKGEINIDHVSAATSCGRLFFAPEPRIVIDSASNPPEKFILEGKLREREKDVFSQIIIFNGNLKSKRENGRVKDKIDKGTGDLQNRMERAGDI